MFRAVTRHLSMVSGLTGALSAAVPGLMLWPRLGRSVYGDPALGYLLLEMAGLGALVLVTIVARLPASAAIRWAASGAVALFAATSGATVGSLFIPAAALFAASGLLADLDRPRRLPARLLVAAGAALAQAGVMAII
jgi:hypothetical protein